MNACCANLSYTHPHAQKKNKILKNAKHSRVVQKKPMRNRHHNHLLAAYDKDIVSIIILCVKHVSDIDCQVITAVD